MKGPPTKPPSDLSMAPVEPELVAWLATLKCEGENRAGVRYRPTAEGCSCRPCRARRHLGLPAAEETSP